MILPFDQSNHELAAEVLRIQKAAYKAEAQLIGVQTLPPLRENLKDLQTSTDQAFIEFHQGVARGAIFVEEKCGSFVIAKLAVDPVQARNGIGKSLVQHVQAHLGKKRLKVYTAEKNEPAILLYRSLGFTQIERFEVEKGLFLVGLVDQT